MPEKKHKLPFNAERLEDDIAGPVLDSIIVHARSHGILCLPGEYSIASRHPASPVKITSTDPDNQGVYKEERLLGGPERYAVRYDIWNYRDSPAFAQIIILEDEAV
jgi:hypothetical protein